MTARGRRLSTRWGSVLLAILFGIVALGQGSWALGSYTLITGPPSPPLRVSLAGSGGLGSYAFVSSVGGVSFGGVARPSPGLDGVAIGLRYNATAPDGQRLQVTAGDRLIRVDLPDWMLVPIARYAGSPYDSCVSLFGPRTTDSKYDIVFHEELQNTLLGLRLLQADMLLFDLGQTWQLPKLGGTIVLGLDETAPRQLNEGSAARVEAALSKGEFQSWVMTDQNEDMVFTEESGRLAVSGRPYYYFWTSNVEAVQAQQERLYQQAQRAGSVAEHNRLVDQGNRLTPEVREVVALTQALKTARDGLRQFNTPVYDAATNTMRMAAFFRYIKGHDAAGWRAFVNQLNGVKPPPALTTPTAWAR